MSVVIPDLRLTDRGPTWRWWVCGLLLLATTINYMDRLTLNLLAKHIMVDLGFDKRGYASIEFWFALAFAGGAIVFGFVVDRWNVFWVYPLAVLAWSAAGFFSGLAQGLLGMIALRFLLGLAESANWPCALRTTQRVLPPGDRAMGNSILQSGAAVGAILIPLILFLLFDEHRPSTWRVPFLVVGACGALWVVFWWLLVRPADLALAHVAPAAEASGNAGAPVVTAPRPLTPPGLVVRRFAALIVLVITINMTWHFLRAWLPLFLLEQRGFNQNEVNFFSFGYYVFTDLGALTAGFITLCLAIPWLPPGPLLVGALLLIGFGALGVFPNYYSFSQDLTVRHQGKITGALGCCCWMAMAVWQKLIGHLVSATGSYTACFLIAGLAPVLGFLALLILWGPVQAAAPVAPAPELEDTPPPLEGPTDERIVAVAPAD